MSRSYRKVPMKKIIRAHMKKYANRAVRRTKDIYNYGEYKKIFCSWEICDGYYHQTWREYQTHKNECYANYIHTGQKWWFDWYEEHTYRDWYTMYKRK